jgi:hypothetical protein
MLQYLNVAADAVDTSVIIRIVDSTDGTPETGVTSATGGLALEYRREGAASTSITEADLTNLTDAHSDGGLKHIGNGYYRVDLPDAACAGGASGVLVHGTVTGMIVIGCYVNLTPAVVNATQISFDSTAADNLETAFDDTAGPVPWVGILDQGTAQSATSTTLRLRAATPFGADDTPIGSVIFAYGSTQGYWQSRTITDYATATDDATVDTWDVTPSGTITYKIFGAPPVSATLLPAVNVTQFGGSSGTFSGGRPEVNTTRIAGAAVSTSSAQIGVNVVSTSTDAITATSIQDGAIDAATFATGAITNSAVAANAIAATNIASGAITSAKFAAGAIDATAIATGAIDADALAADAVDEILDEVVEGSTTLRQFIRLFASALLNKASGLATTTATFRDLADSKNRISATVDADGNRTAVTLDGT